MRPLFGPLLGAIVYASLVLAFVLAIPHTALGRRHFDTQPRAGSPLFDVHSYGHGLGCALACLFGAWLGAWPLVAWLVTIAGGVGYELTNSARWTRNSTGDVLFDTAGGAVGAFLAAAIIVGAPLVWIGSTVAGGAP